MELSGHYDGIPETVLLKRHFEKEKEKQTSKHVKNYYTLGNVDLKQHEHKIPHQNIISKFHTLAPDTKTSLFFVGIQYFFEKSPLKNKDVLWGRFDQSFFVFGDVLTNSGTF